MTHAAKPQFWITIFVAASSIAVALWLYFSQAMNSASTNSALDKVTPSIGIASPTTVQEPGPRLEIRHWHFVDDLPESLAQFGTVFWEPADTISLRKWIASDGNVHGKRVLEIGPGTGLLALCCLAGGAESVTAIDVNPAAVANTLYNADRLKLADRLKVLLTQADRSPFDEIDRDARFDLIISNPPWEDGTIESVDQFALYDPGLRLCDRLLGDSQNWLSPGGKLLLAYGAKTAIQRIITLAPERQWSVRILDGRDLGTLPEVFLPGMLLELIPREQRSTP